MPPNTLATKLKLNHDNSHSSRKAILLPINSFPGTKNNFSPNLLHVLKVDKHIDDISLLSRHSLRNEAKESLCRSLTGHEPTIRRF